MDRFQSGLPDKQEHEPKLKGNCANCKKEIYEGDQYIDHYGIICCDDLDCLCNITDSEMKIAGEED